MDEKSNKAGENTIPIAAPELPTVSPTNTQKEICKPKKYLNPLTLEASIFLNALKTFGKSNVEVDVLLVQKLEEIIKEINSFADKPHKKVASNANLQLVKIEQLDCIKRLYDCSTCKINVGGTLDACKHIMSGHDKTKIAETKTKTKSSKRKTKKQKLGNKIENLPARTKSLLLSDHYTFHIDSMQVAEKLKQLSEYKIIENNLLTLLKPLFPDKSINMYKFGSRILGVADRNSDLDIFVDIENTFETFEDQPSNETVEKLRIVRAPLQKLKSQWTNITAILNARVPIIKARHVETGIDLDIVFSNSLGFCNTKLFEYVLELQPIARNICIFMKRWMSRSKINDIPNYVITLMVVLFLQASNDLPPIADLLTDTSTVGPWRVNFLKKSLTDFNIMERKPNTKNWLQAQIEFFDYYAKFDYTKYIICPLLGKPILKTDIKNEMPTSYNQWIIKNPGLIMSCMTVQDPLQLNNNVAKNIRAQKLKTLTSYFELSAKQLKLSQS